MEIFTKILVQILPIYTLVINIISFVTMWYDKRKAIKNEWRIRERTLMLMAFFMGAAGIFLGMYIFGHKTRHKKFTIGVPLCLLVNIVVVSVTAAMWCNKS